MERLQFASGPVFLSHLQRLALEQLVSSFWTCNVLIFIGSFPIQCCVPRKKCFVLFLNLLPDHLRGYIVSKSSFWISSALFTNLAFFPSQPNSCINGCGQSSSKPCLLWVLAGQLLFRVDCICRHPWDVISSSLPPSEEEASNWSPQRCSLTWTDGHVIGTCVSTW